MAELAKVLAGHAYQARVVLNPARDELFEILKDQLLDDRSPDCRVVHVIGHGKDDPHQPDRLDVVPSDGKMGGLTDVASWVSDAQKLGPPTLFFVDLCKAGRVTNPEWMRTARPADVKVWVIAAAWRHELAYNGNFSAVVADVLARCAEDGQGTDDQVEYVSFGRVVDLVDAEMLRRHGSQQTVTATPVYHPQRALFPFVRNGAWKGHSRETTARQGLDAPLRPFLDDAVADRQHFQSRVGFHFAGRITERGLLAPWLDGVDRMRKPLYVVTGSPGVGKSALLGAMVCAAHPGLRRAAPWVHQRLSSDPALCPSQNPVLAAVHARHRTLEELLASIANQLRLPPPSNAGDLMTAIAAMSVVPVIVIDAVDEATRPSAIQSVLITPLARLRNRAGLPACRVLVGIRSWPQFQPLFDLAAQYDAVLNLDHVDEFTLHADLAAFLVSALAGSGHFDAADRRALRERLAAEAADRLITASDGWGAFLAGQLYVSHLTRSAGIVDDEAFDSLIESVPTDLPGVLELDLQSRRDPARLRAVLAALAYARGDGMPVDLATAAARVFLPDVTELQVREILSTGAGFYVRTTVDTDDTTLFRLFHDGLGDYLRGAPLGLEIQDDPTELRRADPRRVASDPPW